MPAGCTWARLEYSSDTVAVRQDTQRLFNLTDNTDEWDDVVTVSYRAILTYAELPFSVQNYIKMMAVRRFIENAVPDYPANKLEMKLREELVARARMRADEIRSYTKAIESSPVGYEIFFKSYNPQS